MAATAAPVDRPTSRRAGLPLQAWPASDRNAWEHAIQSGDILDPDGAAARWAPTTRGNALRAYGKWLSFLQERDGSLADHKPPEARVSRAAIKAYVIALRQRHASGTAWSYMAFLAMTLRAMAPKVDWDWLRPVTSGLHHRMTPVRNKQARIVPIGDLIKLGVKLMTAAEASGEHSSPDTARQFRDGLLIALLAARPFRRANFCSIEIDRHLIRTGEGYVLAFAAGETKNRRAIEQHVPQALVPALERYLTFWRPALIGMSGLWVPSYAPIPPGRRLWVSHFGTALGLGALNSLLRARTAAEFGHEVNAHLFRDCAVTSLVDEDPDNVLIAAQLLGHSSLRTAERHYIQAKGIEASRKHQRRIQALRAARSSRGRRGDDSTSRRTDP
jgi:integrase